MCLGRRQSAPHRFIFIKTKWGASRTPSPPLPVPSPRPLRETVERRIYRLPSPSLLAASLLFNGFHSSTSSRSQKEARKKLSSAVAESQIQTHAPLRHLTPSRRDDCPLINVARQTAPAQAAPVPCPRREARVNQRPHRALSRHSTRVALGRPSRPTAHPSGIETNCVSIPPPPATDITSASAAQL